MIQQLVIFDIQYNCIATFHCLYLSACLGLLHKLPIAIVHYIETVTKHTMSCRSVHVAWQHPAEASLETIFVVSENKQNICYLTLISCLGLLSKSSLTLASTLAHEILLKYMQILSLSMKIPFALAINVRIGTSE